MPKIVVLGTASGTGKSTLVTVFCYLFSKQGLRVYPYKAQNMSLNSTSTWFGEEIAYVQYVQCLASRRAEAIAHVNPVLLKPVSEHTCEVIILGRPRYLTRGLDYMNKLRARLWDVADFSLRVLSGVADIVVAEGAGAGFEPNLYDYDIANRLPLTHRDSKCVIVADIYRGGAFTSTLGLYISLPEKIRERVIGFIVNKFCGDERLLEKAILWLESKTKKKVLGVVPLREEFNILPEDSLDVPLLERVNVTARVDIAVVWYPGISNFGEIHLLKLNPDVAVRLVRRASELGEPDLIILPGSRNVVKSLSYLKQTGLLDRISRQAGSVPIVGICGGLEILSEEIIDPYGGEVGHPMRFRGLSLIPARVVFSKGKTICRVTCRLISQSSNLIGFEIHRGQPVFKKNMPLFEITRRNMQFQLQVPEGFQDEKAMYYATMIHEVISRPVFLNYVLRKINRKVAECEPETLLLQRLEKASQLLKRYVDFDFVMRAIGE